MAKDERLLPLPTELKHLAIGSPPDAPSVYPPVYDADPFAEKRSIYEYLHVIAKRKWMILAIVLIATISVAIYMYSLPSVYQSQTTILLEARRPKQSKDSINISFGNDQNYRNTQLKLMQNPDLMRNVVIALGLQRNPTLLSEPAANSGVFGKLGNLLAGSKNELPKSATLPVITDSNSLANNLKAVQLTPEEDQRATDYGKMLVGGLTVEPEKDTNLVTLRYQHTNKDLAINIPNGLARAFIAQNIQLETESSKQASEDNIKTIADLQQTINRLENERIAFLKESNLPLRDGKGQDLVAERLTTLSSQWLAAEDDLRKLRAAYEAAVRSPNPYSIPEVNDSKAVQDARAENLKRKAELEKRVESIDKDISDLEAKRSELLVKYTPEWSGVKQLDAQIAKRQEEKDRIQSEVSKKIESDNSALAKSAQSETLNAMKSRYEAAAKRENELRQAYFQERVASNLQGQAEVRLTNLTQEIDTNRKLLDNALQQQKQLELDINTSRPNNIKITSEAQGAGIIGPRRGRNILLALIGSLAAGIGLAFLFDYLDDSVKSSDDVGRHLGLPTLALIPHKDLEAGGRSASNELASNTSSATALVALEDRRSVVAEAYRHLRTSLLFSSAGKPPQTILVTSAQPSEGKTTTAINTAITLAQSGADVVIIDCDLRRPRLHQHFQLDNAHGLTNYLLGERNLNLLLKSDARLPNLKVITSGPIPPNPAEMLGSNEMKSLVEFLCTNFKHVIIDSPPAISFTDAAILSTLVDGVVIVAMAGKSSIHLIRKFKQRLQNIGARVYGVVLNGLKKTSPDYGYGYGYGYSSYYTTYEDHEDETTPRLEDVK